MCLKYFLSILILNYGSCDDYFRSVLPGEFYYSVSIHRSYEPYDFVCSGYLITLSTVFTASICVGIHANGTIKIIDPKLIYIRAGSRYLQPIHLFKLDSKKRSYIQLRSVDQIISHALTFSYGGNQLLSSYDIGLIKLMKPFIETATIGPAPEVNYAADNILVEEALSRIHIHSINCYISDWLIPHTLWNQNSTKVQARTKKIWTVYLYRDEDCSHIFCDKNESKCDIDLKKLGKGCVLSKEKSACEISLGSPVVCANRIWGITTNDLDCNIFEPDYYIIITNFKVISSYTYQYLYKDDLWRLSSKTQDKNPEKMFYYFLIIFIIKYLTFMQESYE